MKSASQMKSKLRLDEIKSAPSSAKGGFHHKVISPNEVEFIPSVRTDFFWGDMDR